MRRIILLIIASILLLFYSSTLVLADECESPGSLTDSVKIGQCIGKFNDTVDKISQANATNAKQLAEFKNQVSRLKVQLNSLDLQLDKLSKDIFAREVKKGVQNELLAARVHQDYIRNRDQSFLLLMFSSATAADFFRDTAYRQKLAQQDQQFISSISGEISGLKVQGSGLKVQKENLGALKRRVDEQANFLAGEVAKANAYVSDLSGKIAALSARQQALLAEKTGTFQTSVGEVPLADDPNSRPDYNPGFSPAFAAFSFGAPHFKGMSQYGAFGRAKAGQDADTILHAYYGGLEIKKDYPTNINITVQGYGTVDLETYVKRIYEMPGSWGDEGGFEALKAQAVAARSYALAYTNNGAGSICASESCQVYKPANKGGKWEEAVNATRGWVLIANGKPFSAWYASTSGGYQESYTANGYSTPGFWDTTSDWTHWADGAWEKAGGSPWFYKGWYRTRSGNACGRSHPWLTTDEFADIINAAVVYTGGGDASGILPTDNCLGSAGWSKEQMASAADAHGGKVSSVSGVSVDHASNGVTSQVRVATNRGSITFDGQQFYKVFNLRAPGAISLKSGLFNIEKK